MSLLGTKLRSFSQSVSALTSTENIAKFHALSEAEPGKVEAEMVKAGQRLGGMLRGFLIENYAASGLGKKSGKSKATGLQAAMNRAIVDVQPKKIMVYLPSGLQFSDGKGSVYAAAGAYRWGAVRQPLTKAKGSLYKDLPTGHYVPRKTAAGDYGEKAKRSIKDSVLRGAGPTAKAHKALSSGKVTVIPPRPPFFRTTPAQDKRLEAQWFKEVKAALIALGLQVSE